MAFIIPPLPTRPSIRKSTPLISSRQLLIPSNTQPAPPWYKWLNSKTNAHVLSTMPDPYASNTKRWETVWLREMHQAIGDGHEVSLLGHASGADACLRYLETHSISGGLALFIPSGDEYFAAERHGRPYHWRSIRENVAGSFSLAWSVAAAEKSEIDQIITQLSPAVSLQVPLDKGFYTAQEEAPDALAILTAATVLKKDPMRDFLQN